MWVVDIKFDPFLFLQAALKESQDECERLQSELTAKQSQYQDTSKLLEDAKSVATFLRTQLDELLEDKKSLEEQLQKHQGEREAGEGTTSDEVGFVYFSNNESQCTQYQLHVSTGHGINFLSCRLFFAGVFVHRMLQT